MKKERRKEGKGRKERRKNFNKNTGKKSNKNLLTWGFPSGAVVKNLPTNAGDKGSSPGPGRSHMLWRN